MKLFETLFLFLSIFLCNIVHCQHIVYNGNHEVSIRKEYEDGNNVYYIVNNSSTDKLVCVWMEKTNGYWYNPCSTCFLFSANSKFNLSGNNKFFLASEASHDIWLTGNVIIYYKEGNLDKNYQPILDLQCPSVQELQNKIMQSYIFCVAEDRDSGTVFVSQAFKTNENFDNVLAAYKSHIMKVLESNSSLSLSPTSNKLNFWVECKSRGYSKAPSNGVHLGMDYYQIRDFTAHCCQDEKCINDSRDGFIMFKNDYGNVDVVYVVDFDYNKVK